ncbi:methyltransferase regulatory domain-containing protein [Paracidobacterium acidisoli]|nr:methyltransferase regulatory domain-containing protein [Paracidobacterium acidisoli]MBT9331003.1 methyltransferase regulatory domain-containing protein [Paracidobacterium acidisoli]
MAGNTNAPKTSYDTVEYPGFSYPDTHPDRLAVMAALHGLQPAPVATCRVLEIGCSEGANLIPMAYELPAAEFTGFDLAGLPIARGQQRIGELGLTNIRLFQGDLMEAETAPESGGLGEYDYIIVHGVYAWVPEPVRDRLLALCSAHLARNGVAFVSYNALPGSHMRNMIREAIVWRAEHAAGNAMGPEEQAAAGLDLLGLLIRTRPEEDPYRRLTEEQLTKLRKRSPKVLFHDELSPVYAPVSVAAFVQHARRHGLEYLSESVLPVPNDPSFRPELMEALREIAGDDTVALEQMLDFARMRMYRETLLVHAEQPVQRDLAGDVLREMRFASQATPAAGEREGVCAYNLPGGLKVGCDQAPAIGVMERLMTAWPRTLGYEEMRQTAAEDGLRSEAHVQRLLQQMAIARMIELHVYEPAVADVVSEKPKATAVSRQEARVHPHAANLWHGTVQLDDMRVRGLLQMLDGTRDHGELLAQLCVEFPEMGDEELKLGLEANLTRLLRAALLES